MVPSSLFGSLHLNPITVRARLKYWLFTHIRKIILFTYLHRERISARDALRHPYILLYSPHVKRVSLSRIYYSCYAFVSVAF